MAATLLSLTSLKATKNGIIGNPSRKSELARDGSISLIVEHLNPARDISRSNSACEESRIEAAHIVSSLSYGSQEALESLLNSHLHHVLIFALSNLHSSGSDSLISALTRAFKAFCTALADIVGPPQWGLNAEQTEIQPDAVAALEEIFQVSSLDVWLPFLVSNSVQISTSIAWVVASCVRHQRHRDVMTQWLPLVDRSKETKGKRGWERPDVGNSNAPGRGGGWLVRNIIELYRRKDFKIQEAALLALAAVIKDSRSVVSVLRRSSTGGDALTSIVALIRSRNIDVQLAACLCATQMIRASPPPPPLGPHGSPPNYDGSPALTIIHILSDLIDSSVPSPAKAKACHILAALTRDEREIEKIAVDVGALNKVVSLMADITPKDKSDWEEDEPEGTTRLREALLMAIAALTLQWDGVRRDLSSQAFFPCIPLCMSHPSLGVRYAACQCARVLCRSVSVLRTSVVDSGMGKILFEVIENPEEDLRIKVAAMAGICNLLNDFSPMRVVLLEQGAISIIVRLIHSEDKALRLNSLWAIKNALFNAMLGEKLMIIEQLRWDFLATLLIDCDEEVREQAVNVVRNLADGNDSDFVFGGLGPDVLSVGLESALLSPNENIVTQGLWAINNLGSGSPEYLSALLVRRRFLEAIQNSLHHPKVEVRRAATWCVHKLVGRNIQELLNVGIEATLRNMTGGPVTLSEGSELQMGYESDREVAEKVKATLAIIESNKRFF